jgi:hypothetical protein
MFELPNKQYPLQVARRAQCSTLDPLVLRGYGEQGCSLGNTASLTAFLALALPVFLRSTMRGSRRISFAEGEYQVLPPSSPIRLYLS